MDATLQPTTETQRRSYRGWFAVAIVLALVGYVVYSSAWDMLGLAWYYNTEEFPYAQEIIRFAELDFRQEFFDIPGTPLLMLGTFLWWPYYLFHLVLGEPTAAQGI